MQKNFEKIANGLYRYHFPGKGPRLLDYAQPPRWEALAALPDQNLPFSLEKVYLYTADTRTVIAIPSPANEMLFGLGLQFQEGNQRLRAMHLRMDHYTGLDNGHAHAPSPMYLAEGGYGVFLDCLGEVSVYTATTQRRESQNKAPVRNRNCDKDWKDVPDSGWVELSFEGDSADLYLFAGDRPLAALQRYNLLCGGGCLPPKWGLGFWHRTHTLFTAEEVEQEADDFARNQMPLDVVGLEPGWQTASYPCTFDWALDRFPDPEAFLEHMAQRGLKVNLWTHAFTAPDSGLYPVIKEQCGSHEVWCGGVPDLSLPETAEAYQQYFEKQHVRLGVSGYKLDECDGFDHFLWPDHAQFPSGLTGLEMRQLYPLLLQKMTYTLFRQKNQRTYGLIRASNCGSSAYPYVIYSDCYDFHEFLTALTNASFIGQLWVPEVRTADDANEWVRRFQLVCLSPLAMLNAWFSSLKPWSFPEVTSCIRNALELRQALIPYLYAAFFRYHTEGIPPIRSMHLEYNLHYMCQESCLQEHEGTCSYRDIISAISDQFMLGDCLMVAPMPPNRDQRRVVLPEGNWYDFYTGISVGSNQSILVETPLDRIPLYVREGGVLPLLRTDQLEVRHYGQADGGIELICDDDKTFDWEQGHLRRIRLEVKEGLFTESCLCDGYPDNLPQRVFVQM